MPDAPGDPVGHLPAEVQRVTRHYLGPVDAALPGRIGALYLVGSVALDDYQEDRSDIDFVAVTGSPLSGEELDTLDGVHRALLSEVNRPWFDGLYLTASDLVQSPEAVGTAPHVHEGRFDPARGFEANPAVWLTLRNHPCPVRGRIADVWHDPEYLHRWTVKNLNSYWAGLATQLERAALRLDDEAVSRAIAWCVPGVGRLAYTLARGDVTSKSGACRFVLETFAERWHPIAAHALAIRQGRGMAPSSPGTADDVVAFIRDSVRAANAQ